MHKWIPLAALLALIAWWFGPGLGGEPEGPDAGLTSEQVGKKAHNSHLASQELVAPSSGAKERAASFAAMGMTQSNGVRAQGDPDIDPKKVLTGKAVLPDGTPLPRVGLRAQAESSIGLEEAKVDSAQADERGQFTFHMEQPGRYRLTALFNQDLDIRGQDSFSTGEHVRLVVDAIRLTVRAKSKQGQEVTMTSVRVTPYEAGGIPSPVTFSTTQSNQSGWQSWETILSPKFDYILVAKDKEGDVYLGLFEGGKPGGAFDLDLVQDSQSFGSVRFVLDHFALPENALLEVENLYLDSGSAHVTSTREPAQEGRVETLVQALVPGEYTAKLGISQSNGVALSQETIEFRVDAGFTTEMQVDGVAAGRFEVHLNELTGSGSHRRFAKASLFDVDNQTSVGIHLTYSDRSTELSGSTVWINAPGPTRSGLLPPGNYRLDLEREGFQKLSLPFRILEAQTETLRATLIPEK